MPAVESVLCIVNSLVSSHVTGSLQETWSYLRRLILYGLFVRLHTKRAKCRLPTNLYESMTWSGNSFKTIVDN